VTDDDAVDLDRVEVRQRRAGEQAVREREGQHGVVALLLDREVLHRDGPARQRRLRVALLAAGDAPAMSSRADPSRSEGKTRDPFLAALRL
jgi:hypothetical protein